MQRKATKNTRGPNADEKRFQGWLKTHHCAWCGNEGPSIVDHARGATFKHNKTLVGHWFCLSACAICDEEKTIRGKRLGDESFAWGRLHQDYFNEMGKSAPIDVERAIGDWGK